MGASAVWSNDWFPITSTAESESSVQTDSLIQLSRAIDAALEAVAVPALLLLGAAVLVTAVVEIRDHVGQRRRRAAGKVRTARHTKLELGRCYIGADYVDRRPPRRVAAREPGR